MHWIHRVKAAIPVGGHNHVLSVGLPSKASKNWEERGARLDPAVLFGCDEAGCDSPCDVLEQACHFPLTFLILGSADLDFLFVETVHAGLERGDGHPWKAGHVHEACERQVRRFGRADGPKLVKLVERAQYRLPRVFDGTRPHEKYGNSGHRRMVSDPWNGARRESHRTGLLQGAGHPCQRRATTGRRHTSASDMIPFTGELQERLLDVRSRLHGEIVEYLEAVKRLAERLPRHFPEGLRHAGFTSIRQQVRVLPRPKELSEEERQRLKQSMQAAALLSERSWLLNGESQAGQVVDWKQASADRRRILLIADAGLGKTWLLRGEAHDVAVRELAGLEGNLTPLTEVRLPVFVRLQRLSQKFEKASGNESAIEILLREAADSFERAAKAGLIRRPRLTPSFCKWAERAVREGRANLLCDGWDEVVKRSRAFEEFLQDVIASSGSSRVVLTSRKVGYGKGPYGDQEPPDFHELELAYFDRDQVNDFAERWFGGDRARLLAFLAQVDREQAPSGNAGGPPRADLRALVKTPLLLTLLCRLADKRPASEPLPALLSEVFRQSLRLFFDEAEERAEHEDGKAAIDLVRTSLPEIASVCLQLFEQEDETNAREDFTADELAQRLKGPAGPDARALTQALQRAKVLTSALRASGLLEATGHEPPRYAFIHRSFLEYFAAVALAGFPSGVAGLASVIGLEQTLKRLVEPISGASWCPAIASKFDNVLAFVPGIHLYGFSPGRAANDAPDFTRLEKYVDGLLAKAPSLTHTTPPREGRMYGLAARAMAECRQAFPDEPTAEKRKEVASAMVDAFEARHRGRDWKEHWSLDDRVFALEQLGYLDDPRLEREDLWVAMPSGEFIMGTYEKGATCAPPHWVRLTPGSHSYMRPRKKREKPPWKAKLPPPKNTAFWIMSRPVTVQDFEPFATKGTEPRSWDKQLGGPKNVPVTGVSWEDAYGFRWWANENWRLPKCPLCGTRTEANLPTEAEWEYVASAAGARRYPWGDDEPVDGEQAQANYWFEGSPRRLTPTGAFPRGQARWPGGHADSVFDLAGNAWEWTLDGWRSPGDPSWRSVDTSVNTADNPSHPIEKVADRVARGGSWYDDAEFLCARFRTGFRTWDQVDSLGFRLVCRCPREHVL